MSPLNCVSNNGPSNVPGIVSSATDNTSAPPASQLQQTSRVTPQSLEDLAHTRKRLLESANEVAREFGKKLDYLHAQYKQGNMTEVQHGDQCYNVRQALTILVELKPTLGEIGIDFKTMKTPSLSEPERLDISDDLTLQLDNEKGIKASLERARNASRRDRAQFQKAFTDSERHTHESAFVSVIESTPVTNEAPDQPSNLLTWESQHINRTTPQSLEDLVGTRAQLLASDNEVAKEFGKKVADLHKQYREGNMTEVEHREQCFKVLEAAEMLVELKSVLGQIGINLKTTEVPALSEQEHLNIADDLKLQLHEMKGIKATLTRERQAEQPEFNFANGELATGVTSGLVSQLLNLQNLMNSNTAASPLINSLPVVSGEQLQFPGFNIDLDELQRRVSGSGSSMTDIANETEASRQNRTSGEASNESERIPSIMDSMRQTVDRAERDRLTMDGMRQAIEFIESRSNRGNTRSATTSGPNRTNE